MAVRQLHYIDDKVLIRQCKPVKEITPRIAGLTEDMFETMYENFDVGLAASQVGVLEQVVTIDVGDGHQYVLIDLEITEEEDEQTGPKGHLSVPGRSGIVIRLQKVKVRAYDKNMEQLKLEGEDPLVRRTCHEYAHLKGELYVTRMEGELVDVMADDGEEEEE